MASVVASPFECAATGSSCVEDAVSCLGPDNDIPGSNSHAESKLLGSLEIVNSCMVASWCQKTPALLPTDCQLLQNENLIHDQCSAKKQFEKPSLDNGETDEICVDDLLAIPDVDICGPINQMKLPEPALSGLELQGDIVDNTLCIPEDDLAEVDWLAFPDIYGIQDVNECTEKKEVLCQSYWNTNEEPLVHVGSSLSLELPTRPVPSKARSKRSRAMRRVWSCDAIADVLENRKKPRRSYQSSSAVSSDFLSSGSDSGLSICDGFFSSGDSALDQGKKPSKKTGCKRGSPYMDNGCMRKCSHCSSTKTPQWRAGPNGPKTLCNACGVRYKSGRLCPEYRPASSPDYVGDIHSNSHRRIIEMRKQLVVETGADSSIIWTFVEHKPIGRSKKVQKSESGKDDSSVQPQTLDHVVATGSVQENTVTALKVQEVEILPEAQSIARDVDHLHLQFQNVTNPLPIAGLVDTKA